MSIVETLPQARHHCIITGTGRAGTSFIVHLLSRFRPDTSFQSSFPYSTVSNAGFEMDIRNPDAPYIVKAPAICSYIDEILANPALVIDHAFIPIRDLEAATQSRVAVQERYGVSTEVPGGLTFTDDPGKQADVLAHLFHDLVYALTRADVPMTFIAFPRLTRDADYLFTKLTPLLENVSLELFCTAFDEVRRSEWVHSFSDRDR